MSIGKVVTVTVAICMVAAMSAHADTTIANNITLTADVDWRADGVVTVPQGVTVDLNGHTLWVSGLAGADTFMGDFRSDVEAFAKRIGYEVVYES